MQNGIPDHARSVAPLREILETAYKKTGKRTKRSIRNLPLTTLGWNSEHKEAFRDLQSTLCERICLSHRNNKLQLWVFTDASDRLWASVVTQCSMDELQKSVVEQSHEPLAFLSG